MLHVRWLVSSVARMADGLNSRLTRILSLGLVKAGTAGMRDSQALRTSLFKLFVVGCDYNIVEDLTRRTTRSQSCRTICRHLTCYGGGLDGLVPPARQFSERN